MKETVFTGAATALITPFRNGKIAYDTMEKLIDWQIEAGTDAIVVAGTTGEGATLSDAEHKECIRFCVEKTAGRVPVIAGTGSNDTYYACKLTEHADACGADAMLLVTPYYNKATQKGLIASFREIAGATSKPCILYNVPSRTGCNMLPETVAELAETENIVGIKEASGNLTQIADIAALCGDKMDIYSGNDDQIIPVLAVGGKGVISVLSNLLPGETSRICHDWLNGEHDRALKAQLRYLPLIHALFSEVNPIPVKAAMHALGLTENSLRLPLTCMEEEHEKKLIAIMRSLGMHV